jgi:hypothetical protein
MFAFDSAHFQQCGAQLPQKVRLGDFISSFMGTSSEVEATVRTRKEMQGLFANGVVFFNHFLRLTHDPTENALQAAFARGAALFAPFNFPGCDLIIVFDLSAKRYTFVIIQVKNRRNDSVTAKLKLEAANGLAAASRRLKISSPAPPHIAIMMCLSSDQPTPNAVIVRPQAESGGPTTRNSRKRKASPTSDTSEIGYRWETPLRILLLNVGLNETLYPTLGQYSEEQDLHRVIELLKQLLDCIPQVSVPAGSRAYDEYQRHLMPIP